MSQALSPAPNLGDQDNKKAPRLRSRRNMLTGFSLLSRGEPFVWLTGGMLMICLAMMVGLLSLILWQGLSTFWPRSLVLIPTRDRAFAMGEDEGSDEARRILRSGNFEFSGRHYTYVNSVDSWSDIILVPNHAWLFERVANGRLVGIPLTFESTLFLENLPEARTIEAVKAKLAEENAEALASVLQELDTLKNELQQSKLRDWIQSKKTDASIEVYNQAQLDRPMANDRLVDSSKEYFARWSTPESFPELYRESLERTEVRRKQLLKSRQQLSRLDAQLHDAVLEIKEFERVYSASLMGELEGLAAKVTKIVDLQRSRDSLDQQWKVVLSVPNLSTSSLTLLKNQIEKITQQSNDSIATSQTELDADLNAFLTNHSNAKSVVERYLEDVQQTSERRSEIQESLNMLEAPSETDRWQVSVPVVESSSDLSPQEWQSIESEKSITEVVAGKLGVNPGTLQEFDVELDCKAGKLVELRTTDNLRMMLWASFGDDGQVRVNKFMQKTLPIEEVVRAYPANSLGWFDKLGVYASRWGEFVSDDPREANSEGGVFPAIWGTVVMTLIMSIVVIPFGVMAALYLREYTNGGFIVALIRVCINNLAGVPSIVYGVFGLAFFCYTIGGYVDGGPAKIGIVPWPSAIWFTVLAVTAILGFAAFLINVACMGNPLTLSPWKRRLASYSGLFWLASLVGIVLLMAKTPFFDGFYAASLPTPTFGKGALIWASLTLSLLTLPVVIVATEEALSAVPNSLREGSYACGASKWQTIQRIVLPHARPGILTGSILAMARGAGEVAPLILVGALPSAVDLPLDGEFPFFHGSRSFMHLGFQIFHQGFMSQNSEASKPMVFTSTLLLILIIALLNLVAIGMRSRLRKRFQGSQF